MSATANPLLTTLTDASFDEALATTDGPLLIDFWAEWCGPCRMLGPVVESLAADFKEQATIAKVDIDANPALAQRFGIRSIPTVLLVENGEVSESWVGVQSKETYASALAARVNDVA